MSASKSKTLTRIFIAFFLLVLISTSAFSANEDSVIMKNEQISVPSFILMEDNPQLEAINQTLYEAAYRLYDTYSVAPTKTRAEHWDVMEYITQATVTYETETSVSVKMEEYLYPYHGAHGNHLFIGLTFNKETGLELALKDIFIEGSNFKERLDRYMKKEIKEREIPIFDFTEFKGIQAGQEFYLTEDELIILYQEYEYTPYAYGVLTFEIPFSYLDGYLRETIPLQD